MWHLAILPILGVIAAVDMIAAVGEADRFKISTKRSEDRIEIVEGNQAATLIVHSPSGIGKATIERLADAWPEKLLLRFPFRGLESLKISAGKLKLNASVSSHDGTVRIWKDDLEDKLLDAKSPHWLKIQILDRKGNATQKLPLHEGVIQIELPKNLLGNMPASFQVDWIDFYRG